MSQNQTSADQHDFADEIADDELLEQLPERQTPPRLSTFGRCAAQVLWPAFLGAAMAVGLIFSAIDPIEMEFIGVNLMASRPAAYTVGFFVFWMLFIVSGTITWFLASADHQSTTVAKEK